MTLEVATTFDKAFKRLSEMVVSDTIANSQTPSPMMFVGEYTEKGIKTEVFPYMGRATVSELAKKYSKEILNNVYPVYLMQVSEAWIKTVAKEEFKEPYESLQDKDGNPKDGVDEVLIVAGSTFDKSSVRSHVYSIVRNPKDNSVQDLVEILADKKGDKVSMEAVIFDDFYYELIKFGGKKLKEKVLEDLFN